MAKRYQVAALAVRRRAPDRTEILLVTSRETGRWVVPKGWPWPKTPDHEAAAGEAWEEAGVRGRVDPHTVGSFTYEKRMGGKSLRVKVSVFLLEVTELSASWPELAERRRRWFSRATAAELVDEPELKVLILGFAMPKEKRLRSRPMAAPGRKA